MSDSTIILAGYKRCSRGDECIHPDGPILPVSEFEKPRSYCRECKRGDQRRFRAGHIEEVRARDRARYRENAETIKASRRIYNKKYSDKLKACRKKRYDANAEALKQKKRDKYKKAPAVVKARVRQYRLKNPDKVKQTIKKWQREHLEELRVYHHNRRGRQRSLPNTFTLTDWQFALNYWQGRCAYCGNPPSLFDRDRVLHQEHYMPITNENCPGTIPANMLPACQTCNFSKTNKLPDVWLIEHFGKRRGSQIQKAIATYFDEVKRGDH